MDAKISASASRNAAQGLKYKIPLALLVCVVILSLISYSLLLPQATEDTWFESPHKSFFESKKYDCLETFDSRKASNRKLPEELELELSGCFSRLTDQIDVQLSPFKKNGIQPEDIDFAFHELPYPGHSVIIRKFGGTVQYLLPSKNVSEAGFKHGFQTARHALRTVEKVLRRVYIPDFELLLKFGDKPVAPKTADALPRHDYKHDLSVPQPVFSLSTSDEHWDIAWPRDFRPPIVDMSDADVPWSQKEAKAVWRGGVAGFFEFIPKMSDPWYLSPRGACVRAGEINSSSVNSGFTSMRYPQMRRRIGAKNTTNFISWQGHLKHKYLLVVDGFGYTGRFSAFLSGTSVCVKLKSPLYEFFYPGLARGFNIYQCDATPDGILDAVYWLQDNDEVARYIGLNARKYFQHVLSGRFIMCYMWYMLHKYAEVVAYDARNDDKSVIARYWTAANDTVVLNFRYRPRIQYLMWEKELEQPLPGAERAFIERCQRVLGFEGPKKPTSWWH